jgi:hypothetical protein
LDVVQIYTIATNEWFVAENRLLRPSYLHHAIQKTPSQILIVGGLREKISNRFLYSLGAQERTDLPEKVNTMFIDPLFHGFYTEICWFNEDMCLLTLSEDGSVQVLEPPPDL